MGAFEIAPGKEKYATYFSGVIDKGIFLPAADYHNTDLGGGRGIQIECLSCAKFSLLAVIPLLNRP